MTENLFGETLFKELAKQLPVDGAWKLDEPKLWWTTRQQLKAYSAVAQSSYHGIINEIEDMLVGSIDDIIEQMPLSFSVIDLGCGSGEKGELVVRKAKQLHREVAYMPVDINPGYTAQATSLVSALAPTNPMSIDFMESELPRQAQPALILLLGNTYGNFQPRRILPRLHRQMREEDVLAVNLQLGDSGLESTLVNYHTVKIENWAWEMMKALGFSREAASYRLRYNRQERRIEFGYDLLAVPPRLREIGMLPGDSMALIVTRKPSREQLISELSPYFAVRLYEREGSSQVIVTARRKM